MTPIADTTVSDAADVAQKLGQARRVLVTGLRSVPADVLIAACNLAEALGAAIDAGDREMARPTGPTIARAGEITADREELRDRADLTIVWFCDPQAADQTFLERYVTPSSTPRLARRTVAVGPHAVPGTDSHVLLPRDAAVDAARVLRHRLLYGGEAPGGESLVEPLARVAQAIEQASCVAIVTDHTADPLGLEPWSIVHLIRTIAHRKAAFEIPLAGHDSKTAAAVLTWRYGAAGAIAKADRSGGAFLPAEASAVQLIDRGEVDCVAVVGTLAPAVERALTAAAGRVSTIRLDSVAPAHTKARLESIVASIHGATADTGASR